MSKSRKECIYKGCNNTNLTSKKTMFHFPNQETKYDEWIKRSHCDVNSLSQLTKQFLCEDHFDSIYMTCNQRRKLLLSTAVPYPYEQSNNISKLIEFETEDEIPEEPLQKKTKLELSFTDDNDEVSEHEDYEVLDILDTEPNEENNFVIEDSQELIIVPNQEEEEEVILKPATPVKPKRDQSLVTTFIFKGEEYIQMPKEMYDQQDIEMSEFLKNDFEQERKTTEIKMKRLEEAVREKDKFVLAFKELLKKYELVSSQNEMYKTAVEKAKEALFNIPE